MKQTKIILEQPKHHQGKYKVIKLINRTVPAIGHLLTESEVAFYIRDDHTVVEIKQGK